MAPFSLCVQRNDYFSQILQFESPTLILCSTWMFWQLTDICSCCYKHFLLCMVVRSSSLHCRFPVWPRGVLCGRVETAVLFLLFRSQRNITGQTAGIQCDAVASPSQRRRPCSSGAVYRGIVCGGRWVRHVRLDVHFLSCRTVDAATAALLTWPQSTQIGNLRSFIPSFIQPQMSSQCGPAAPRLVNFN